ncbi:MAG: SHOCT domain-containing protein [Peptococcaceae bacterium]|nr:SHOCT domain-containing protein [Peptococcaceae bacterium]
MMGYNMMSYGILGSGMMVAMVLWGIVLLAGVFLACYGIFRLGRKQNETGDNALERLKMRFASGEISQEEYAERKQLLQG